MNGYQLWGFLSDFSKVTDGTFDNLAGYGQFHNWTKRSIFWDLLYLKDNLLRHNLGVMHIENNFFDNVFNTVMDVKCKTKDNEKERLDVVELYLQGDLELVQLHNGKLAKPEANYTFSSKDAKSIYKWISELKMPNGYASNIARCANPDKESMHGIKSHDCHVFMKCLLPITFRSLPDFVWSALAELSRFFKDLCSNTLRTEDVVRMQENIPIIICKLERIFPPTSFDSLVILISTIERSLIILSVS